MRTRTIGKVFLAIMTALFVLLAIIYAWGVNDPEKLYHGARALSFAILSLTSATCYRYFED